MNFFNLTVMSCARCIGVRPAAGISPTSTSEIIPSGRTGKVPEMLGSCQTVICNESSGPITYLDASISPVAPSTGAAATWGAAVPASRSG